MEENLYDCCIEKNCFRKTKSRSHKGLRLINTSKIKTVARQKDTINKIQKQATDWKKISAMHIAS